MCAKAGKNQRKVREMAVEDWKSRAGTLIYKGDVDHKTNFLIYQRFGAEIAILNAVDFSKWLRLYFQTSYISPKRYYFYRITLKQHEFFMWYVV